MTQSHATQKIQTAGEAIIRIREEANRFKRMNKSDESTKALYEYVFGDGENPYKDITEERDRKLELVEDNVQEILNTVR